MVWKMPKRIREGRQLHVKKGTRIDQYYEENSRQGIDYAGAHDYDSIDLDGIWTKPDPNCTHHAPGVQCYGHLMNTHYDAAMKHGFYDPHGKMPRAKLVSTMTYDEAARLETAALDAAGNPYRIEPMARQLKRCRKRGLVASVEAKHRKGWTPRNCASLMRAAVRARCKTIVKSAYTYPLVSARKAGFQTRYTKFHKPGM